MANTSRSRSVNSSSRNTGKSAPGRNVRSGSKSSRGSSRKTSAPVQTESGTASFLKKFASSKAAMPLIFIASVILITGIDLLVSWNKYDVFFKILGVEILIAVVIWIILTLVFSGRKNKDSEYSEDEV